MDFITNLAEWLSKNPWGVTTLFILAIIGAVGVPLSLILHLKSRKTKLSCYDMRSNSLVRDMVSKIGQLEMHYSGQPIRNLTATKIMFWSAGSDIVGSQDIAPADPIVIAAQKGIKILDARMIHEKTPVNQFSITPDASHSSVRVDFDFVDKNQFVVAALLHTGNSNDDFQISGTIKGGKLVSSTPVPSGQDTHTWQGIRIMLVMSVVGLILGIYAGSTILWKPLEFLRQGDVVVAILGAGGMVILVYLTTYLILRIRTPKGVDAFQGVDAIDMFEQRS